MPYHLRPWTERDTGIDREVSQSVYPEYREEPGHRAWFAARQLGAPRDFSTRYVVEGTAEGRTVAYATLWELRPGRYRFDLAVRPECRRRGIGTRLFTQLIDDARALRATGLQARVRDDKPEALAFVLRRRFHESHRMGAYHREFVPSDADRMQPAIQRLSDLGIAVISLAGVRKRDADYLSRFCELYSAAREGWPDPDPDPAGPTIMPFDALAQWLEEVKLPEAFFLATHEARYVAFSSLFGIGTAVHPQFRGRSIATHLRAMVVADAPRRGLRADTTSTANPAMQAVLERLGYRRLWSEIRLIRSLE